MSGTRYWADDPYWTEALERLYRLQEQGKTVFTLDLAAILEVAYNEDGPAYKLMEGMLSVREHECLEGFRGAPRVMLALLVRLEELSHAARSAGD